MTMTAPPCVRVVDDHHEAAAAACASAPALCVCLPTFLSHTLWFPFPWGQALEAMHVAVRRGLLPEAGAAMVHLDAHPDLSVPRSLPCPLLYSPRIHDLLHQSPAGIAEWILPAAFTGQIASVLPPAPPPPGSALMPSPNLASCRRWSWLTLISQALYPGLPLALVPSLAYPLLHPTFNCPCPLPC